MDLARISPVSQSRFLSGYVQGRESLETPICLFVFFFFINESERLELAIGEVGLA